MTNSSANHVENCSQLPAFLGEMVPFKVYPSIHGHLTSPETGHSKSNLGNFQYQYLTEYNYRFMAKMYLLVVCMGGSFNFSNPVTSDVATYIPKFLYHK